MTLRMISLLILIFGTPALAEDRVVKNGNKESTKPGEVIPVNRNDLRVLRRAEEILKNAALWNRQDNRECPPTAVTFSLYCSLQRASLEINGEFDHRLGAIEEVRRTVEDRTRGQPYEHRLMDFNNDRSTTFHDIREVLKVTEKRIQRRISRAP